MKPLVVGTLALRLFRAVNLPLNILLRRCAIAIPLGATLLLSSCQQTPPASQSPASPATSIPTPTPLATPTPLQPLLPTALTTPKPAISSALQTFLADTATSGAVDQTQGVWIQTRETLLANHQGTVPLSAASLTKVATSLAALETLGANYRYQTNVGITGTIQNGVVQGDLVVEGGQNPFFVWEDAIALANLLQQQGIRAVQGNLVIRGPFYMNFESGQMAAEFLRQGLDASLWPPEALQQYQALPPNTPKPQLPLRGSIVLASGASPSASQPIQWVAQQQSFPLSDLLKKMNRFSNNAMAEMIATSIGGATVVQQKAIAATGVTATEIQLVNGSGLAVENRMSARAACGLFLAIERLLQPQGMGIADIFNIVGNDEGILDQRVLPQQAVIKSGTLNTVSALAGTLTTQKEGTVWFAILNNDGNVDTFRSLQEQFLANLQGTLGKPPTISRSSVTPTLSFHQLWKRL